MKRTPNTTSVKQAEKTKSKARKKIKKALVKADNYESPESMETVKSGRPAAIQAASAQLTRLAAKQGSKSANPDMIRKMACYAKALIDPESEMGAKVPDRYTIPTATYQSVYTYSTQGNQIPASAINVGRFCVVVKPTLGTTSPFSATQILSTVQVTNDAVAWQGQFNGTSYLPIPDPNGPMIIPDSAATPPRPGLAMRARIVGASVWAEYEGSSLLDGGSIAAAFLPADAWGMQFTSAAGLVQGNLTFWENLAEVRNSYQGKVKDGAYVWWKPNAPGDVSFYPVDDSSPNKFKQVDLPIMVVSGQLPAANLSVNGQPSIVRFRIVFDYEYETSSRVVTSKNSPFIPGAVEVAEITLQHVPQAMANDRHESWINTVARAAIGAASGFALGGPIGAAAGALTAIGVSAASK